MSEAPISQDDILLDGSIQKRRDELLETAKEALEQDDETTLRLILNNQHASDIAELLRQLPEEDRQRVIRLLATSLAAATLTELDASILAPILESTDDRMLSRFIEAMDPDDATDILGTLPEARQAGLLTLMESSTVDEVEPLLTHAEDTGGGIMTSRLVAVREDMSVSEAISYLREWAHEDDIFYLYTVDAHQKLTGTVPLRRLLIAAPDVKMSALMDRGPITVRVDMDQEEVARIFADYDLLALPVVDNDGVLIGQVTVDDVVDVIQDEATEDIYEMAAMSSRELEERTTLGVVRRRLPWLLVCLAGTLFSGTVLDLFELTINRVTALVLFIPAIMAMGGNSGLQTTTVTVRNLAIGHLQAGDIQRTVFRELRIALSMGMLMGLLMFNVAWAWTGDWIIGGCVAGAMCATITQAAMLGAVIPLIFRRIGIDPAVASGPLITTLNDGVSLIIYFSLSVALLNVFRPEMF